MGEGIRCACNANHFYHSLEGMVNSVSSAFHNRLLKNILGSFYFSVIYFSLFISSLPSSLSPLIQRPVILLRRLYSLVFNHRTTFFCCQVSTEFGGYFIGPAVQSRVRSPIASQGRLMMWEVAIGVLVPTHY